MRLTAAVFLALFMLPALALADQFDDGYTAFHVGETDKALTLLQPLAEKGCSDAQELLGEIYLDQGDKKMDIEELEAQSEAQKYNFKARHWFLKAADQGNADAQYNLGWMYEEGWGGKPDLVKAYMWNLIALNSGHDIGDSLHRLKPEMTPNLVARARRLAASWKQAPSLFPLLCARMQATSTPAAASQTAQEILQESGVEQGDEARHGWASAGAYYSKAAVTTLHAADMDSLLRGCSKENSHAEMRACLEMIATVSKTKLKSAETILLNLILKKGEVEEPEDAAAMKNAFKSGKQAFQTYRYNQCEFYASMAAGGNGAGDLRLACIAALNTERAEQLQWAYRNWSPPPASTVAPPTGK